MFSTATATAAVPPVKKYGTYGIRSFYQYQLRVPSNLHSVEHYYADCERLASESSDDVMILREEVVRITGWNMVTGWAPQHDAETDGYVDVRTGKKYANSWAFHEDIA